MTCAAKIASARPAPIAPAGSASGDGRLKLQAFVAAAPQARANWELQPLGALGFELASARG